MMNSDQIKGTVKDAAGKVQRKAGEVMGSTKQQLKGLRRQRVRGASVCSRCRDGVLFVRH